MLRWIVLVGSLGILMLSITVAQNVSVQDYEVPVSSARSLWLTGFWNWAQSGDSVTSNRASIAAKLRWFYSSLPFAWFVDFDGSGGKEFGTLTYDLWLRGSIRKYFAEQYDWFGYAQLGARYRDGYDRLASDLAVGAGYGRFIDATALAKAVRIEEQLLNEQVLTEALSKETLIRIANIIEREAEYREKYREVYEVYWLRDIEAELVNSGKLHGEKLSAIGVFRIRQVLFGLNQIVNPRYFGWDLAVGVNFVLTTPDDRPRTPQMTVSGRYSYPIGWRMQLNALGELLTPLDSTFLQNVSARVGVDYIYELSNRINFVLGYAMQVEKVETVMATHLIDASFVYYLEANFSLGIGASTKLETQQPNRYAFNVNLFYTMQ